MSKRVLIVEDNDLNRRFFNDVLVLEGYETLSTAKGDEAAALASAALPDLILMDIRMPDADGLEATRRLKRDPATEAIPVIAVTGCALSGDEERFRGEGCADYLAKPVSIAGFLSCVEKHLQ
ncbi:MAG: response regulator [Pseudomonadota bacterium]